MSNPEDTGLSGDASMRQDRSVHDEYSSSTPTIEQETVVERLRAPEPRVAITAYSNGRATKYVTYVEISADVVAEAASRIEQLEASTELRYVAHLQFLLALMATCARSHKLTAVRLHDEFWEVERERQAVCLAVKHHANSSMPVSQVVKERLAEEQALSTSYRKALEEIVNASPALVVKAIRTPEDAVGLEAWTAAMLTARQVLSRGAADV
jgi:hypothetical protein